jgi:hypothetical protein
MTTQTFATNSIMAYVGANAGVVGVSGLTLMPDWEGSRIFFLQTSVMGPGIRQFNIDTNGDETLQQTQATLGLSVISAGSGGAACVSYDGTQLYLISGSGNSVQLAQIQASNLTLTATFGTAGNSTLPSTSTRILAPQLMTMLNSAGSPYLLMASAASTEELDAIQQSGFTPNVNLGDLTQSVAGGAQVGHGKPSVGAGNAYALGLPFQNGTVTGANSLPIGVYSVNTGGITSIGTFKYSDVDATWSKILNCYGVAFDETDGNLIVGVETNDAVAHQHYIAKISHTTGGVLWTVAVNQLSAYSWGFTLSRIRNSKLHYLGGSGTVYHINTSAGTATTEVVSGLSALGPQASDDVTNSIILFGNFSPGGSPPNYVGTYMGTNGNHNVSDVWMRFWFATAGGGGGGNGGNNGGLTLSKKRAWTYTMDGHTHYVLDLISEGTWVYDVTTKQWAHFYTSGMGQWDMQVGTQWGIRVVAGDLATTDVWELTPTALTDNSGALQIPHVVTGGLQVRTRIKQAVGALRITAADGNLGNIAGSVMNMRFSDDQARTWSPFFTVTLSQGDFGGEIAYRALGAFAAPGRIFELSDTGGPVRIDGCDAEIDGVPDGSPSG